MTSTEPSHSDASAAAAVESATRTPSLTRLGEEIRERLGDSLQAIVLYGSVLRDGSDEDRLYDLLAIVDGYRDAYGLGKLAILNAVLPPNVFHLQVETAQGTARAKFAVVSAAQLLGYTGPGCLQVYFWGRLAQPTMTIYARDPAAHENMTTLMQRSATTFVTTTAPLMAGTFSSRELWTQGLKSCYATELRSERPGVGDRLYDANSSYFIRRTKEVAETLGWPMMAEVDDSEATFAPVFSRGRRWGSRQGWRLRRVQGKVLHILRLMKAVFTFEGGLDYIVWKIERHSGAKIEVSDLARRHPLLAGWPVLWKLYRRGGFR